MPRVNDEYLEQRRRQILDAARRCFAQRGFYETTLQDVFAESGLSAGAVYRYFKTKDDLIQAISASALGQLGAVIEDALAEDPLPGLDEIVGRIAAAAQELSGPDGPARIGPAAWAAALHDPKVAVIVRDMFGALRAQWATAVRRMVDDGRLAAETDIEGAASALFALLPGFLLQYLILGDIHADALRSGLRALLRPAALSTGTPDDGPSLA
jgi:AcrR family transcriptional regulator